MPTANNEPSGLKARHVTGLGSGGSTVGGRLRLCSLR